MKYQDWRLMSKDKLMPEIRFPEFIKKEDWKVKTIDELCDILNNIRKPISSGDRKKGSYPYYGASGIIDYVDDFLFDERLLLIGEDGAKWGAYENTAFLVEGKYWVNNHAHVLKPKLINDKLLESYLVKLDLHPYITGAAPPKLTLGKLKEIPVPVPESDKEQQKIASCLSSLDEVIAAHSQKLALLKDHKKGLMQNLFPQEGEKVPKYRFKEFEKDGEWEEKKLGELGDFLGGGTPSRLNSEYWSGNIPWISSSDINENDIHNISISQYINENAVIESATKIIPKGSILFVSRVGVGKLAINNEELCTSQDFTSFIPTEVLNLFVAYYFSANKYSLKTLSQGTSIKGFSKSDLEDSIISYPKNPKEQQKIATCLSSLDALITAQAEKIEQLKLHKKGLMQGLFPKIND